MQTHVKVLGILNIVFGSLSLLGAGAITLGLGIAGAWVGSSGDPDAHLGGTLLGLIGVVGGVALAVYGAVCILTGWGLLNHKSWARILGIILCAFSLIKIPIGTIFGIYGLWVLFNKETEALFTPGSRPGV